MVVPSYSLALNDEVVGTFFQALTYNSTVTSLKVLRLLIGFPGPIAKSHSSLDFAEGTNSGP